MPQIERKEKMGHASQISEHQIQSQILNWLQMKHIYHFRMNVGGFIGEYKGKKRFVKFGPRGAPDIIAVIGGQIFGIEVKSGEGFQSQVQVEFQVEFERAGGRYILARRLEDVEGIVR